MEGKNQLIYNYIYNLSNSINKKYGVIIDNSIFNSVVNQYTNSLDDVEKIKKEIDNFCDELIKKEEKIDTPTDLIEKIRQLNPSVQINVSNLEYENELKIDSSIPIEKLNLPEGFYYNEKNGITNKHLSESGNYINLHVKEIQNFDDTFVKDFSGISNKDKKYELLDFYVKKYNDFNKNINLEDLDSFLKQKYPNFTDSQRLVTVYSELKDKLTNDEKDKIFESFCKIDSNIKTENDFLALLQDTKLITMNVNENIKELSKNGQLIKINADIESGFNYPFILYIPNGIDKSQINNLLLHSCNTPYGMIDYKSVEEFTISCQLDPNSLQFSMVNSGKIPLIMPIIPRFIGYNPEYIEDGVQKSNIETFIKMQSKLEPKYQMTKEQIVSEFNRSQDILLQQMNMCDYAISYLRKQGIKMSDNIKVEGHSAGSKNAASLGNAFPERIVKNNGFFLGATTGRATINDNMVTGVIYNGTLDNNNPAEFYVDEKGLPHAKYEEEYSDKYMLDEQRKYNESLEEWKKENPNKDLKEFDIVKYNIRKQQERESKLGRTSLLVEGGHNVCQNEIIKEAAVKFAKEREKIQIPDISQSTNIKEIANVMQLLNPTVDIRLGNPEVLSYADNTIFSSVPMDKIKLPEGFYYNEKNGITNKNKTENGNYVSLNLNSIDSVPKGALISKSANLKTIETKEKQIKKENVTTTIPSMTQNRKQEIVSKKTQKMKMTSTEKKVYSLLTQKRQKKIEQRKNKQSKTNVMTYKKPTQLNSNKSSNGFINIIYASIILLVIVIIYLVLVK